MESQGGCAKGRSAALIARRTQPTNDGGLSPPNLTNPTVRAWLTGARNAHQQANGLGGCQKEPFITIAMMLLEILSNRTFFAPSGFVPVHKAHLAAITTGTLCGIAFAIIATRHCKSDMKV